MFDFLTLHEPTLRLAAFAGVLALMLLLEFAIPRRGRSGPRLRRWTTNLALAGAGTLLVRFTVPLLAAGVAVLAERQGFGLFHWTGTPEVAAFVLSIVALDLLVYVQHAVFHKFRLLWRLHRVHHADPDLDATTGIRFHPVEILLSMGIKMGAVALLGAPAAAVILFEVLLNATAMFNHSNINIGGADKWIRLLIVTPDMHRIHHSIHRDEYDTNFGFNLSIWDRIFGSYRACPREGHEKMRLGLSEYPAPGPQRLGWSLMNPFWSGANPDDTRGREKGT